MIWLLMEIFDFKLSLKAIMGFYLWSFTLHKKCFLTQPITKMLLQF